MAGALAAQRRIRGLRRRVVCGVLAIGLVFGSEPCAFGDSSGAFGDPASDSASYQADIIYVTPTLTPTTLRIDVLDASTPTQYAPLYGGVGMSLLVAVNGYLDTGVGIRETLQLSGAGSYNLSTGKSCPQDTLGLSSPQTGQTTMQANLSNTARGCLGHLVRAGIAIQTTYNDGSTVSTDQAPDNFGPYLLIGAQAVSTQPVMVYGGGSQYYRSFYSGTWPSSRCGYTGDCLQASFGDPGDQILTANHIVPYCALFNDPNCASIAPDRNEVIAVRTQSGGGLRWFEVETTGDGEQLSFAPAPIREFSWGNAGDIPVSGDWDGDGLQTVGLFRPSTGQWFLTNDPDFVNQAGAPITVISFGSPGDQPIAADWTGEGATYPGVFRNGHWYELRSLHSGGADVDFVFGQAGDVAVPGDWNQDGIATPGVYRSGVWFQTNNSTGGAGQNSFVFGAPGLLPLLPTITQPY